MLDCIESHWLSSTLNIRYYRDANFRESADFRVLPAGIYIIMLFLLAEKCSFIQGKTHCSE
jgi:hypothetical protein